MNGWIALSRKLLDWQWHDEPKMVALWVHILLRASHETTKYRGITTQRGQLATTYRFLAATVGLSLKEIRICIKKLQEEQSITLQGVKGVGIIITVNNYDQYQTTTTTKTANQRAHQSATPKPSKSDDCEQFNDNKGHTEGIKRDTERALKGNLKGHSKGIERAFERAHFSNCESDT